METTVNSIPEHASQSTPPSDLDMNRLMNELTDMQREAHRPSEQYLRAVQDIAKAIGLDTEKIAAGAALQCNGITFWIGHHGQLDPEGMVLRIHMGAVPTGLESVVLRQLLEHNAVTPAAVSGYYSLLPGTDIIALCVRLNLAKVPRPRDAILAYIGLFAKQVAEFEQMVRAGVDQVSQQMPAEASAGGTNDVH